LVRSKAVSNGAAVVKVCGYRKASRQYSSTRQGLTTTKWTRVRPWLEVLEVSAKRHRRDLN